MQIFTENSKLNFLIFSNSLAHLKFSKFTRAWPQEESAWTSPCPVVISLDQKLIQCQSQPRVKVKLAYKGNSFPCQTLKNSLGFFLICMFPQ